MFAMKACQINAGDELNMAISPPGWSDQMSYPGLIDIKLADRDDVKMYLRCCLLKYTVTLTRLCLVH